MRLTGVCLVAGLGGCSTMVHGTTQVLPVTSNPPGELVTVDNVPVGVTPLRVTLSRDQTHVVIVGSDSAKTGYYPVDRRVSAWVLANAFVYYLPALVDFGSGGGFNLSPDTIGATFREPSPEDAKPQWELARGQRIRLRHRQDGGGFVETTVDSTRGDSLLWYGSAGDTAQPARFSDLRVQVRRAPDRKSAGLTGMRVTSAIMLGLPFAVGAANGEPVLGLAIGVVYSLFTAPFAYPIGAMFARSRWSPLESYRDGSPLLVGERVRLLMRGSNAQLHGRLADIDGDTMHVVVRGNTVRVARGATDWVMRPGKRSLAGGARRGIIGGAAVGFLAISLCNCKATQSDIVNIPLAGAVLGLLAAPMLAPRRWVEVPVW